MPGIATHLTVLNQTVARLAASGDAELTAVADALRAQPAYAHLGAIGPALADFMPNGRVEGDVTADPNPYAYVWKQIFALLGGDESRFPGSGVGLHAVLVRMRRILDELTTVADAEDCDRLEDIRDGNVPGVGLGDIETTANDFAKIIGALDPTTRPIIGEIASTITDRLKPVVDTAAPTDPVPPPEDWHARDFLHWRRTGAFVDALLAEAAATGDDRLRAYAYGYLIGYAANVCGSPFVNSCVGGPHRTQWWRRRFTNNFIDAWVHGHYAQDPRPAPVDAPAPPYPQWPSLCSANLQKLIEIQPMDPAALLVDIKQNRDLPAGVIPDDFAQSWFKALTTAHPGPLPAGLAAEELNGAYQMTWLMLWVQTSGEIVGCNFGAPVEPPGGCGTAPGELDPFVPAPGGGPSLPPAFDTDLEDTTAVVCGILLAILGGLLLLGGALAAGAVVIVAAVALLDCSNVVEWQKLRCQLFWYRMYLYNGLKGMNELLALAGFAYPYAEMLAEDEIVSATLSGLPFESGRNLVKSRVDDREFPSKPWDGSILTFNQRPTAANPGFEKPRTTAYRAAVYPSHFIDDDVNNPLSNGDIGTAGAFPVRLGPDGQPLPFGNAVANAVDLLSRLAAPRPGWNLDGDRGLAHLTWEFDGGYDPDAVTIRPAP
ncbi:hypothetical protein [Streptomyces sp. NPDC047974]|uniref:hypothetical protein n=1 Tax=Streptomyces sp. NPDC047974 TaxID=3154343 RepID=UPI0033D5E6D8